MTRSATVHKSKARVSVPILSGSEAEVKVGLIGEYQRILATEKGYTYDKLFTTGHLLELLTGTRVVNPYATNASVYKAIKAICDNVPQAKIGIYTKKDHTKTEDAALLQLLEMPNEHQTFADFLQEWTGYYALSGEGFIRVIASFGQLANTGYRLPARLEVLNPAYMHEDVDISTQTLKGWRYKSLQYFTKDEIIHTKDFNPYNKWRGLSPLKPINDEMEIDQASVMFNLAFFKNDASPGFVLSTDQSMGEETRTRLIEWWEKTYKGVRNAWKPAVLEKGLKPIPFTNSHKEMEFTKQKELMREEIIGTFRVPKAFFGITDQLNYATFMGQMRVFWIYTLIPIMGKFASSLNMKLVAGYNQGLQFDFDLTTVPAFQQELQEKMDTANKLFDIGFNANEINSKLQLGFDKVPWREHPYVVGRVAPVEQDGSIIYALPSIIGGGLPGEPKPPKEEPVKTVKSAKEEKRLAIKLFISKDFIKRHSAVENKFESKLSRYFMELRTLALKTPQEAKLKGIIDINWHLQNEKLKRFVRPLLDTAIKEGVDIARTVLGQKSIVDSFGVALSSYLEGKVNAITQINATIEGKIKDKLGEAIKTNGAMQSDDLVTVLDETLRGVFNSAVTRSKLIARTETTGAMNGSANMYYGSLGIEQKEWLTAGDEFVRESHRRCEEQGAIPIDKQFANGLEFPGDQIGDAGEICNCRCALMPIVNE